MRIPLAELRKICPEVPAGPPLSVAAEVSAHLVRVGLEEEGLHYTEVTGPVVVGEVLSAEPEPQKNGKVIRWCQVRVGPNQVNGIVCGADNFGPGDRVVVALAGAVLPGGFEISARKTYAHVSDGMICSERELGLGDDHDGILVLGRLGISDDDPAAQPGADALGLLGADEVTIDVNVTPDRGYCWSFRGLGREYALATDSVFVDPVSLPDRSQPQGPGHQVRLADEAPLRGRSGCDRYVARSLTGFDPTAASPAWLRRVLRQSGMRSISLAVDITNYVMLLTGQPLHAFDADTLAPTIVVRRARSGERLTTLDGVERVLHPEDLVITDEGGASDSGQGRVLALAGVMGGATSEITATTTNILLEAAHFDPITVARTSRRHKLSTEAGRRFERGVDPELADAAAEIAIQLLLAYGGGDRGRPQVGGGTHVHQLVERSPISFTPELACRLIGVDMAELDVRRALQRVGCQVSEDGTPWSVTAPSWRPDLERGADLVEEIARIYGYERIPAALPPTGPGRGLTRGQRLRRSAARTWAEHGLVEVLTYPFVAAGRHDEFGLGAEDARRTALILANPLNEQAPQLRTNLLATLVDVARRNASRGFRDIGLYEIGPVFRVSERREDHPPLAVMPAADRRPSEGTLAQLDGVLPEESLRAALVLAGQRDLAGWWGPGRPVDWSDAVEAVQVLATSLGVARLVVTADHHEPWHPGRCARLSLADGTLIGHAGELAPAVVAALDLPARTCAAEIELTRLLSVVPAVYQAAEISPHPVALRDIALIVDDEIAADAVSTAIRAGAGPLLDDLRIFDDYRGERIGAGMRSLAYRLTLRAPDRTLTGEEATAVMDAAVAAAASATGAVLRDGS